MISKKLSKSFFTAVLFAGLSYSTPITLSFTNSDVDLGASSQINLTNQYSDFGIQFEDVYRYIDSRDPFSDEFGISNGRLEENYKVAADGKILFDNATPYVTIDWWSINGNDFAIDAFDVNNNVVSSFSGIGSGTTTLTGNIASLVFHDHGGFVEISNMAYEKNTSNVPEPAMASLMLCGLFSLSLLIRRKK